MKNWAADFAFILFLGVVVLGVVVALEIKFAGYKLEDYFNKSSTDTRWSMDVFEFNPKGLNTIHYRHNVYNLDVIKNSEGLFSIGWDTVPTHHNQISDERQYSGTPWQDLEVMSPLTLDGSFTLKGKNVEYSSTDTSAVMVRHLSNTLQRRLIFTLDH